MHEAVEVARGGAVAGLRKELLMPPADARRVLGSPVQVGPCSYSQPHALSCLWD